MSELIIRYINRKHKVYVNGEYMGYIHKSDYDRLGIKYTDEPEVLYESFSDEYIDILKDIVLNKAFNKAVGYAAVTECCESVIRYKLKLKEFPDYAIDNAVCLMHNYNYINDERYAESYVRSYINSKSRNLIRRELEMNSLKVDNLDEIIDRVYTDEDKDTEAVIKELLRKKFKGQDLKDEKVKQRMISFLIRRGFSFEEINNIADFDVN